LRHRVIETAAEKTVGEADASREAGVRLLFITYILCNGLEIYLIFWLVVWEAAHLRNPVIADSMSFCYSTGSFGLNCS
jgi:hypothetical protein